MSARPSSDDEDKYEADVNRPASNCRRPCRIARRSILAISTASTFGNAILLTCSKSWCDGQTVRLVADGFATE